MTAKDPYDMISLARALAGRRILVYGDLVADEFVLTGSPRVSREAPVLILEHRESRVVPGGGANAAAVMNIGRNLLNSFAPKSTALYPATVACDDKTSMLCAREIRGISSSAKAVTRASASALTRSALVSGESRLTSRQPFGSWATSSAVGGRTLSTMAAP